MSCHFLLHFLLPPDLGIEPASLASALPGGFFTSEMPGKIRTTLCVKYCYSQFTDENSETQRHELICPKSHSEVTGQREGTPESVYAASSLLLPSHGCEL